MKKALRRMVCLLTAAVLLAASLSGCQNTTPAKEPQPLPKEAAASATPVSATGDSAGNKKSETVYVTLDPAGQPYNTIVTNWLHTGQAGSTLTDPAALDGLTLIKGGSLLENQNGQAVWQFDGSDLYYSGTTDRSLPLEVSIAYTLDGVRCEPAELAGRSGHLVIDIALKNRQRQLVQLQSKTVEMAAPLTVVMGLALPEETFRNVSVSESATVTGDGNNQIVSILAMPGLEDSLNLQEYDLPGLDELNFPEQFTITSDVVNFELGPIAIACTTGFPDPDIDSAEIDEMERNINDLKDMQNDLEAMDGDRTIRSLFTDPWMTRGAQIMVDDLFDFYDMDTKILDYLPGYVTDRNIYLIDSLRDSTEDVKLDQLLSKQNLDALAGFLHLFNEETFEELLNDTQQLQLAELLTGCKELFNNELAPQLVQHTAELGRIAMDPVNQRAIVALSTLSRQLESAGGLQGLEMLYNASGLGSLSQEQLAVFVQGGMQALASSSSPAAEPAGEPSIGASGGSLGVSGEAGELVIRAPAAQASTTPVIDPAALNSTVRLLASVQQLKSASDRQLGQLGLSSSDLEGFVSSLTGSVAPVMEDLSQMDAVSLAELRMLMNLLGSDQGFAMLSILQSDLADNQQNLTALQYLREHFNFAVYRELLTSAKRGLFYDLADALDLLDTICDDLENEELDNSLHRSPETIRTLLRMRDDLEKYRKVSEVMRVTVAPDNANTFAKMIATLDRLEAEGAAEKYAGQVADIQELLERKDAYVALSKQHATFTGAPEGYETELKFVMKTDEIKIPKAEPAATETQEESGGPLRWLTGLFQKKED